MLRVLTFLVITAAACADPCTGLCGELSGCDNRDVLCGFRDSSLASEGKCVQRCGAALDTIDGEREREDVVLCLEAVERRIHKADCEPLQWSDVPLQCGWNSAMAWAEEFYEDPIGATCNTKEPFARIPTAPPP